MGFAAVIDTVLLLVVLERINRPQTAVWLKCALLGATLWHLGSFLHTLFLGSIAVLASTNPSFYPQATKRVSSVWFSTWFVAPSVSLDWSR